MYFFMVLKTESPRSRCHRRWFFKRYLFLACGRLPSSCVLSFVFGFSVSFCFCSILLVSSFISLPKSQTYYYSLIFYSFIKKIVTVQFPPFVRFSFFNVGVFRNNVFNFQRYFSPEFSLIIFA